MLAGGIESDHHHHLFRSDVVKARAIAGPTRLAAARVGNLDARAWPGERLHEHLAAAEGIGDPMTVRRELRLGAREALDELTVGG